MCHLTTEHRNTEDSSATIATSKSKIEVKKEGIKINLLSSDEIEEKDASERLKEGYCM